MRVSIYPCRCVTTELIALVYYCSIYACRCVTTESIELVYYRKTSPDAAHTPRLARADPELEPIALVHVCLCADFAAKIFALYASLSLACAFKPS